MSIPGGGRRQVGSVTYTVQWRGAAMEQQVNRAVEETMQDLRKDVEAWLHTNLHRWTGEMERMAFSELERVAQGWILHGGSDSDHTIWHEIRFHPQLRQCLDTFAPQIGPRLKAKLG